MWTSVAPTFVFVLVPRVDLELGGRKCRVNNGCRRMAVFDFVENRLLQLSQCPFLDWTTRTIIIGVVKAVDVLHSRSRNPACPRRVPSETRFDRPV